MIPTLETLGEQLYALRAQYMLDATREEAPKEVGLTVLYNRLKDPRVTDPRIAHLRTLHEELDRAVLAAYGWSDIAVPAYTTPESPEEKLARERFDAAVIDRLFELNAQRAAEEKGLDPSAPSPAAPTAKPAKTRAASKSAAGEGTAGEGAPAAKKPGRKPKGAKGKGEGEGDDGGPQGALPIG